MTTEKHQPPLFERENSKYDIVRYKMPFWYLIQVIQTQLYAKGFVVPMGGTLVYRTFSNYIELWTKYHLYRFFSIKVVLIQQKVSCFQIDSIMYWQYILILISMWRLHLSSLYVGHICIIKRLRSKILSWDVWSVERKPVSRCRG